jgi:hypothetical protein
VAAAGVTVILVRCRSCRQPVEWALTSSGRAIPLDPAGSPGPPANLEQVGAIADRPVVRVVPTAELERLHVGARRRLRRSHFATCPHADTHRRAR